MLVDTNNLKTVAEVATFFNQKLGIKPSYFPVLMDRGKVTATTLRLDGRIFFVINPAAEDWDIKVDVKATKE